MAKPNTLDHEAAWRMLSRAQAGWLPAECLGAAGRVVGAWAFGRRCTAADLAMVRNPPPMGEAERAAYEAERAAAQAAYEARRAAEKAAAAAAREAQRAAQIAEADAASAAAARLFPEEWAAALARTGEAGRKARQALRRRAREAGGADHVA